MLNFTGEIDECFIQCAKKYLILLNIFLHLDVVPTKAFTISLLLMFILVRIIFLLGLKLFLCIFFGFLILCIPREFFLYILREVLVCGSLMNFS